MDPHLGQFVYFNKTAWYGARVVMEALGDQVRPVDPLRVINGATDPALFLSFLTARYYPQIFPVLRRAGIRYKAADRGGDSPVVIAGGAACFNPEPIADFVDVVFVGDGEPVLGELARCLAQPSRARRIDALAELPGAYVPGRRQFAYTGGLLVTDVTGEDTPIIPAVASTLADPPPYPGRHGEVEVARSCRGRCFFCSIAWTQPYRERPEEDALRYSDLSLFAPNAMGVSYLQASTTWGAKSSLGDVRVDDFCRLPPPEPGDYAGRRFTLGVEGIVPRLRRILGKPIDQARLHEAIDRLVTGGATHVQLYYIRGVPTETESDWDVFEAGDFEAITAQCRDAGVAVEFQFTPLTRQPHTPLQWVALPYSLLAETRVQRLLKLAAYRKRKDPGSMFYITPSRRAAGQFIDTLMSCGSRRAGSFAWALSNSAGAGLKVDRFPGRGVQKMESFARSAGIDPDLLLDWWPPEAVLPWSHIKPLGERADGMRQAAYRVIRRRIDGQEPQGLGRQSPGA